MEQRKSNGIALNRSNQININTLALMATLGRVVYLPTENRYPRTPRANQSQATSKQEEPREERIQMLAIMVNQHRYLINRHREGKALVAVLGR